MQGLTGDQLQQLMDQCPNVPIPSALNTQAGGTHYKDCAIQPIQYIHANGLDFFQGNIVKYATRHKAKNGAEDLKKVIHYAQLALELQYGIKPTDELADMTRAGLQFPSIVGHTPTCWCEACDLKINGPLRTRMSVCPACRDKRCPRAKDHRENCSNPAQAQAGKSKPGAVTQCEGYVEDRND